MLPDRRSPPSLLLSLLLSALWLAAPAACGGETVSSADQTDGSSPAGAPDGQGTVEDTSTDAAGDMGPLPADIPDDIGYPDHGPPIAPVTACETPTAELTCGSSVSDLLATVPHLQDYACQQVAAPLLGAEAVLRFAPTEDTLARFSADAGPAPYLAQIVLQGECAGEACIVATEPGDADRQVVLQAQAGEVYWFVLDSTVGGLVEVDAATLECSAGEVCGDGIDNDWDDLIDCADPDCADPGDGAAPLPPCEVAESSCDDGIDNDGDGLIDCADPSCPGLDGCEAEEAACGDGLDNDADGATDCADPGCLMAPDCIADCADLQQAIACGEELIGLAASEPAWFEHACAPGAWGSPEIVLTFTAPHDGHARVGLELTDANAVLLLYEGPCDAGVCTDKAFLEPHHYQQPLEFPVSAGGVYTLVVDAPQMPAGDILNLSRLDLACSLPEDCSNGLDDDWDGKLDCADPDCLALGPPCEASEESCADGFDNDGDGDPDCADATCVLAGPPCEASEVSCVDGLDNDGDGAADCGDDDCSGVGPCEVFESLCTDGQDNDGDGAADCEDIDCAVDAACDASCPEPIVLECGHAASGSDAGSVDLLATSACLGIPTPGDEVVYQVTPPQDSLVTFTAAGPGNGSWVMAVHQGEVCAASTCAVVAPADATSGTLQTWLPGGEPAWLVVDSSSPGGVIVDGISVLCE